MEEGFRYEVFVEILYGDLTSGAEKSLLGLIIKKNKKNPHPEGMERAGKSESEQEMETFTHFFVIKRPHLFLVSGLN